MEVRISLLTNQEETKTSILANNSVNVSMKELANCLSEPDNRISGEVCEKSIEGCTKWNSQQVFILDFSGAIIVEEFITKCRKYNLLPAFIYTNLYDSKETNNFRVVFITNEKINDIRVRNLVHKSLITIFSECTSACQGTGRTISGGAAKVYEEYSNTITVLDVYFSVCTEIRVKGGANATRNMKNFCKSVGINMLNGYPKVAVFNNLWDLPEYDCGDNVYIALTKTDTIPINNNSNCTGFIHSSYMIWFSNDNTIDSYSGNEKNICPSFKIGMSNGKKTFLRDFDFTDLYGDCQLYRETIDGSQVLDNYQLFGLMSNLLKIKGGTNKIDEILKVRVEYMKDILLRNALKNQIMKLDCSPCQCDRFCPYSSKCIHGLNLIEQGKLIRGTVQVKGKREVKPLKQAEKELECIFNDIIENKGNGIYIIKAPTGLGKTNLYIKACKDRNMTIAVPTHQLKEQVSEKLMLAGISHFAIPQLPIMDFEDREELDRLYDNSSFEEAYIYLKGLAKENKDIERYLKQIKQASKIKNQTIVTTHQRILFNKDFNDICIIDEDIILNGLYKIGSISMNDFNNFYSGLLKMPQLEGEKKIVENIYRRINSATEGVVEKMDNFFMLYAQIIEKLIIKEKDIKLDVLGFLNSNYFVKAKSPNGAGVIYFITKRELPINKKIIILSATINEMISRKVFGDNIDFYDIGEVEQKGEIWQVPTKSCSKYTINQDKDGMLEMVSKIIDKYNPNSKVITYKGYFESISETTMNFWNTAGRNDKEGDNITIIGTPHINENCYLLLSSILGYNVQLEGSKMKYQPVNKGIYRFYFQTYGSNDFLREIQFYMIESELLQTVGRARTLRNKCRVLVLSNYPVPGARFINIPQSELKKYRNKN